MVRLELMRLNTMPALDPGRLTDAEALSRLSSQELRELGRLPEPMIRRKGDRGFTVISWEEAYDPAAAHAAGRASSHRLLPDIPRHPERDVLRRAEGRASAGHEPRGQLGAALPRRLHRGHEGDARLRRFDLHLHGLAQLRPDRLLRIERPPTTSRSR